MFRTARSSVLAILLVASVAPAARCDGLPPLIPRETFTHAGRRDRPSLSPDGKWLAYLAPVNGVVNIRLRAVGGSDDRALTAEKIRVAFYWWQADGEHLLYSRDQGGDENWHLFQVHVKTGLTRDLTPFTGRRALLVGLDWNVPNAALVSLNLRHPGAYDVYRIDLKSGALSLDTKNPGDVVGWQVDRNLRVRAIEVRTADGGRDVRVRDDTDKPWRTVEHWGPDEHLRCGVTGFSDDGRSLYLLSSRDSNTLRLVKLDLAGGPRQTLAEDSKYDASAVQLHPETGRPEAVQFVRDRAEWQVLDNSVRADFDALRKVCEGDFEVVGRDRADRRWLVWYTRDDAPNALYLYDRGTRRGTPLWDDNPQLARYRLAKIRPIAFKARDGLELHGYLTLPVGPEPKNLPAVVFVHGGPWSRHTWARQDKNIIQLLANRGYAVLQVNYRGSVGYGKRFVNAGNREAGAKMLDDVIDVKRWAVAQGYIDPKRVGVLGPSFGGYLSLAAVAFTPDEFACAVDVFGPSNLVSLIRSFPIWWARSQWYSRVGNPDTEEAFLRSRSPLYHVDRIKAPVLVLQGDNDVRVPKAESDQIVQALRRAGKDVEYVVFPKEGHGLFSPANDLKLYEVTEHFLARTLGGRAQKRASAPAGAGSIR
jgi:dipeptidyl aminopeptidase/acylaminoacyl peptidase